MADIKDFKHAIVRQKILDAVRKDLIGPTSDAIVFTATEQIPSEKLLPVVFEKQKVHTLLQVITYWVNDNEYMIDFVLWQG